MTCEWCSSEASTTVTVDPGGGVVTVPLSLGRTQVRRPARQAPACAACAKRLLEQPPRIEKARKSRASTDGQTTIFDALG
jgi:hypothetical protein